MKKIFDRVSMAIIVILAALLLALGLISLMWSLQHPTPEDNKYCIRAGYDYATQKTLGYDVYCVKTISVNINDVEIVK